MALLQDELQRFTWRHAAPPDLCPLCHLLQQPPGRREQEGDALIPDPSLLASFPLLKVHVSRWSQK